MSYINFINKLKIEVEESYEEWMLKLTRLSFDLFLDNAYRLQYWVDMLNEHPEDMDWANEKIDEKIMRKGG